MPTMIKNRAEIPATAPISRTMPEREEIAAPIPTTAMPEAEDVAVVTRADWVSGAKQGAWTYETYAAIPEDGHRYEVVEGVLYCMPAPTWDHQRVIVKLTCYLESFIEDNDLGEMCVAPVDVELHPGTVVQPDVVFLLKAHLNRIVKRQKPSGKTVRVRVAGSPDLVVEIASPSTASHDRNEKLRSYARAGVPEYWILDPRIEKIEVLVLEMGTYRCLGSFSGEELLPSRMLPDFPVKDEKFFPKPLVVEELEDKQDQSPEPTMVSDQTQPEPGSEAPKSREE